MRHREKETYTPVVLLPVTSIIAGVSREKKFYSPAEALCLDFILVCVSADKEL